VVLTMVCVHSNVVCSLGGLYVIGGRCSMGGTVGRRCSITGTVGGRCCMGGTKCGTEYGMCGMCVQ
jgi:hypothetical protein